MTLDNKRYIAFIVTFAILDPFVTYHSLWKSFVVVVLIVFVTRFFYYLGKEDKK